MQKAETRNRFCFFNYYPFEYNTYGVLFSSANLQ